MSEMIERVAKALEERLVKANPDSVSMHDMAVACIEAMREPTHEMLAAVDCGGEKRDWLSGKMHLASWQAMIDEALK